MSKVRTLLAGSVTYHHIRVMLCYRLQTLNWHIANLTHDGRLPAWGELINKL